MHPVIEAHGLLPLIRRATALGNNDCFAGLSTATLVDATFTEETVMVLRNASKQ